MIVTEILKSLGEGNVTKGLFLILIFAVIWLEVRGMKKQLKMLNETVLKSFADGEKRFETIEANQKEFEHRLTVLEQPIQGGVHHGKTI